MYTCCQACHSEHLFIPYIVNVADYFAESIFITAKSKAESDPHAFRTFR